MSLKVTVVVPVYNPGQYIEDCIQSMIDQSLPEEEYEVYFVDDGSTDETPARLDRLAAEQANMHVIHQEASGWSGKPRNVGIDAAKGEYIMFVDNDDYLGTEALERMYDYGVANGADVVVGRMAGKGRGVPRDLFRKNYPRATVQNAPLMDSLTPHKMVRREFLEQTGLRYREGRRRLEDHVFVTEAYLRAANVSVLSDYVCYYHIRRDDANNAAFRPIDPAGYYNNLREALDVVELYTEPGPLRDRLFRRWLTNEMVERLRGQRLLGMPPEYRQGMFREMRGVVLERFGPGVAAGLTPIQQVVAALMVADRLGDLETLAEWESTVKPVGELRDLAWQDGTLQIAFDIEFASGGDRLTFDQAGAETHLALPVSVAPGGDGISAQFEQSRVDVVLRDRATGVEFYQPVKSERENLPTATPPKVRLRLRSTATIDPRSAAAGVPLNSGVWDLIVRYRLSGWVKETRLGSLREPAATDGRRLGVVDGMTVLPYWTEPHGNMAIEVDHSGGHLKLELSVVRPESVQAAPGRLAIALPVYASAASTGLLRLVDAATGEKHDFDAGLKPTGGGCLFEVEAAFPPGRYKVKIGLGEGAKKRSPTDLLLVLTVEAGGAISVQSVKGEPKKRVSVFVKRVARRLKRALR